MKNAETADKEKNGSGLTLYSTWLSRVGVSRTSGWRWQKLGWIKVINIAGRPYVKDAEAAQFIARAEAGEFARERKAPVVVSSVLP